MKWTVMLKHLVSLLNYSAHPLVIQKQDGKTKKVVSPPLWRQLDSHIKDHVYFCWVPLSWCIGGSTHSIDSIVICHSLHSGISDTLIFHFNISKNDFFEYSRKFKNTRSILVESILVVGSAVGVQEARVTHCTTSGPSCYSVLCLISALGA